MPKRGTLSINKAKKLIKYKPSFNLEKGYQRYINWYKIQKNSKLRFLIFFNNYRGIEITKIFLKKRLNFDLIITKKFLNLKVIDFLKKKKIPYKIIKDLKRQN